MFINRRIKEIVRFKRVAKSKNLVLELLGLESGTFIKSILRKRRASRGVAKSRHLVLELLGLESYSFDFINNTKNVCFKRCAPNQESGCGSPWTGNDFSLKKTY